MYRVHHTCSWVWLPIICHWNWRNLIAVPFNRLKTIIIKWRGLWIYMKLENSGATAEARTKNKAKQINGTRIDMKHIYEDKMLAIKWRDHPLTLLHRFVSLSLALMLTHHFSLVVTSYTFQIIKAFRKPIHFHLSTFSFGLEASTGKLSFPNVRSDFSICNTNRT